MDDTVLEISKNWLSNVYQEYLRKRNHSADDFVFLENVIPEVSELIFTRNMTK